MPQTWYFRITDGLVPAQLLAKAFFASWGRVPRMSSAVLRNDELRILTESPGSGTIHVPVPFPDFGTVMTSTESLISRGNPYLLLKELCRGSLGQIYLRLFDWHVLGFHQPELLSEGLAAAAKRFAAAAVEDIFQTGLEEEFLSILEVLTHISILGTKAFTEQSLAWRMRNNEKLPVFFGAGMTDVPLETLADLGTYNEVLQRGFHAVLPMPPWRELEPEPGQFHWERLEKRIANAARSGRKILLGPLLSFAPEYLPTWLVQRLGEEGFLETRITRFVNSMSERYGYLADGWILANRFQLQSLPEVSHSRLMGMVRILAQQMRSRGIETPIAAGIEQPWGEFALTYETDWEQVQIAEALMGCREIDSFLLEINLGSGDNCTLPYDPMCISSKIDQWSFLDKKVFIMFSVPDSGGMVGDDEMMPQWTEALQRVWTDNVLFTLFGRRMIRGIIWTQLQDSEKSPRGLLDVQRQAKETFRRFAAFRETLLR
ncbi:MAG: beta-galactosidase [Planctomycetaceae bacterium]|jgi:hypothetical protein|nr:beta-galactosidase [Planctomycetaceae bacterium]